MIVGKSDGIAEQLKELLEFMEAFNAETATIDNWRSRIGDRELLGVFLGSDLTSTESERLVRQLGKYDPNVSIVVVEDRRHAA